MKPVSSLDILRAACSGYRRHAATILAVSLAFNGAVFVLSVALMAVLPQAGVVLFALLAFMTQQLTTGAATRLVTARHDALAPPGAGELVRSGAGPRLALLLSAVIYGYGIAIFGLLLVLPGIYVAVRWSLAVPALLVERVRVRDAFTRSQELTGTAPWASTRIAAVMLACNLVAPQLAWLAIGGGDASLTTAVAVIFLVSSVAAPLPALAYAELYAALTALPEEAAAPEEAASTSVDAAPTTVADAPLPDADAPWPDPDAPLPAAVTTDAPPPDAPPPDAPPSPAPPSVGPPGTSPAPEVAPAPQHREAQSSVAPPGFG